MSGGKAWEAVLRSQNSSSSKPTADSTASDTLGISAILYLLAFERIGVWPSTISLLLASIEFRNGLKPGGHVELWDW